MAQPLKPGTLDLGAARTLLVVKPSSLGDIVHTLPAVALIKRAFPHLSVSWVARSEFAPLLDGNPDLDGGRVIEFPRARLRGVSGALRLPGWARRNLRPPVPDVAVDFQGLLRSGVMARASGCRQVVGLSDARECAPLFHHWQVAVERGAHAVERYLEVPRALGVEFAPGEVRGLFRLPAGELPAGFGAAGGGPVVVVHPFSRGAGKSLSLGQVRELCAALAPLRVVLVGRRAGGAGDLPGGAVDLVGRTTLAELIGVMRRAQFVVSVDSGPMHIAAAITDRLLSIHTWSDPRKVGPFAPRALVWKDGAVTRMGDYRPAGGGGAARRADAAAAVDVGAIAAAVRAELQV